MRRAVIEGLNSRADCSSSILRGAAGQLPIGAQSAALCYRLRGGRPEVLLITTRRSQRWIIPKGWLIDGLSPSQSAEREAWEEAGVLGRCSTVSFGSFTYVKNRRSKGSIFVQVAVFPLHVNRMAADFPEAGQRNCKWLSPQKAAEYVHSRELAVTLREFACRRH